MFSLSLAVNSVRVFFDHADSFLLRAVAAFNTGQADSRPSA
jgi:hypothetical protein